MADAGDGSSSGLPDRVRRLFAAADAQGLLRLGEVMPGELLGLVREAGYRPVQLITLLGFDAERCEAAKSTIWTTGCRSWYLDDRGIPASWPWSFDRFREEMSAPRLDAYEQR